MCSLLKTDHVCYKVKLVAFGVWNNWCSIWTSISSKWLGVFPRELIIHHSPAQSYTIIQTKKEKAAEFYSFSLFSVSDGVPLGLGDMVNCMIKWNCEVLFECNSSVFSPTRFSLHYKVKWFLSSKLFNGQAWTWNQQAKMHKITWESVIHVSSFCKIRQCTLALWINTFISFNICTLCFPFAYLLFLFKLSGCCKYTVIAITTLS